MKEKIQELRNSSLAKLEKLVTTDQLSDWHRDFLGRKGELTLLLKQLGELPAEERPAAGKEVNRLKLELQEAFDTNQDRVRQQQLQQQQESQHPLLVTICCWTLSRFAGAIVTISSGSGEAGRDLYDQMHKSLLFNLRSLHPKVVESALSAVAVSIERSSFALLVQDVRDASRT